MVGGLSMTSCSLFGLRVHKTHPMSVLSLNEDDGDSEDDDDIQGRNISSDESDESDEN